MYKLDSIAKIKRFGVGSKPKSSKAVLSAFYWKYVTDIGNILLLIRNL